MFQWLEDLIGDSIVTYPVTGGAVAVDGFFPVVPGETVVITAAIVAVDGGLLVWLVFLSAWLGAFAGDNVSYLLGARVGRPAARRLFKAERSRRVVAWAYRQLQQRRTPVIVGARFVPGGRTAVTFASGLLDIRWRSFAAADAAGAGLWATYATALGWFGGATFKESFWKPMLISFAIAGVVAVAGELVRRATEDDRDERAAEHDVDELLGREPTPG